VITTGVADAIYVAVSTVIPDPADVPPHFPMIIGQPTRAKSNLWLSAYPNV
jgi:hypothetical protein